MKCRECGSNMESRREPYRYLESGLDNVILNDTLVSRCPKCGETEVAIQAIESLHRELARTLAQRKPRLSSREIRFMRKHMGYSSVDFAAKMGVTPSTVSRWESEDEPKPMGATAERLLRVLVLQGKQVASYPLEEMASVELKSPPMMRAVCSKGGAWQTEAA